MVFAPRAVILSGGPASVTDMDTPRVPQSVLEAIKMGMWDYEPESVNEKEFSATYALPGSDAKLEVLAKRVARGLPLWHSHDRRDYEEEFEAQDA